MLPIKIIEDPLLQKKWYVHEKKITTSNYFDAVADEGLKIKPLVVAKKGQDILNTIFYQRLKQLFSKGVSYPLQRCERDILRNPTLEEYWILNLSLLRNKLKYNKKIDEVIEN